MALRCILLALVLAGCSDPATDPTPPAPDTGTDAPDATPDLDEPECRNPADCPLFFTCRDGACVETTCGTDADCGAGNRCEDARCVEVGDTQCVGDDDCGFRWRCGDAGRCLFGECEGHPDCGDGEWCRENLCVRARDHVGEVRFERTLAAPLTDHQAGSFDFLYGWGGALLDADGDGDLDVFLGTLDPGAGNSPACLYRNESEGQLAFGEGECEGWGEPRFGVAMDLESDGTHELVTAGRHHLRLHRFAPAPTTTDLLALLAEEDPRRLCDAGAALPFDLDLDGHLDLVVGCTRTRTDETVDGGYPNLALRWNPDTGAFEPFPDAHTDPVLADPGYTLALGALDVDRDGLLDLLVANDTFTARDENSNFLPAGSAAFRCPPTETCTYTPIPFDEGNKAWGSFMGFGAVHVDGLGEHIYISDFGPNRLVGFDGRTPTDRAPDLGAEAAVAGNFFLFGWAVLVDDYDHNGLDDILLTNGNPERAEPEEFAVQQDMVLFQTSEGRFSALGTEIGLTAPNHDDSLDPRHAYSSRGGVRADLDQDGYVEIVHTGLTGFVKLHVEQPTPDNGPRCTIIPVPRVVPSVGYGVGVRGQGETEFHYREIQGQIRWGSNPWIVTRHRRGMVRFASGAELAYDCGDSSGPVRIEEPEWIRVSLDGEVLSVELDSPWMESVELEAHFDTGELVSLESGDGVWTSAQPEQSERAILRLNGRWLGRWFR